MRTTLSLFAILLAASVITAQDQPKTPTYSLPEDASFNIQNVAIPRIVKMKKDEAVSFDIAGSLRIPTSEKPEGGFPAVLFISGSGAQTRHGFQGKLDCGSWELLDAIGNAGFVTLSTDDRGIGDTPVGEEDVDPLELGYDELVGDARAALNWLARHEDVDKERIFLIGHSEGGITAPILAGDFEAAGVIFMAAAGRNMYDVTYEQVEDANADSPKQARELNLKIQREIQDAVKEDREPDYKVAGAQFEAAVKQVWKNAQSIRAWWHDHFNLDVPAIHKALTCPCFVAQGASDFQVKPEADAEQIVKNLVDGECDDIKFKVYDDLDHLFKACDGRKSEMKMYFEDRRVSEKYIEDVVAWLKDKAE